MNKILVDRDLIIEADSYLSLLRHRCESLIPWDTSAAPSLFEMDQLIGKLRKSYENRNK